ncbi:MAG: alpha/beta hydrolase domain-containing protein [Acidimicrobiia bacterium]
MAHLCGRTLEFAPKRLRRLYRDHDDYVARFAASCAEAVARGHLLAADEVEINALAAALSPLH